jgi:hypothetical protein
MLALFAARANHFASHNSQTFDEGAHLVAGVSYWRTGDFRLNPEHPPLLKLIWALPVALRSDVSFQPDAEAWNRKDHWTIADQFLYEGPVPHGELLLAARRANIVLGVALVALIGWWAYRLWGRPAGLLACAIAATDPNLVAFSALLSMDLGLALFGSATAYALWEYAESRSRRWFLAAGIFLGLALATKFTAIVSFGGLAIGALGYSLTGGSFRIPGAVVGESRRERVSSTIAALVRLGLIAVVIVVLAYAGVHALEWARGLKQQLVREEQGDPHFYLNGENSTKGWWNYFVWVLAIKTPAGTLLLALASVMVSRWGRPFTRRDVAFLLFPAGLYFLAMTVSRIDIGWRVILPAYPALILLAARSATLVSATDLRRFAGWGILSLAVVSNVHDVRHLGKELSYANGLVVGRDNLHRYLGDSNIDWGQGLGSLSTAVREAGDPVIYLSYAGTARPEAYGFRHERLPGWGQFHAPSPHRVDPAGRVLVAVSVSNLQGTYLRDPATFRAAGS